MTPRPNFTHKQRPLSAIFIGSLASKSPANTASPPDLPKLPGPPGSSPGSSSGLPSPPATNSTGSGSAGDECTPNKGSVRQRPSQRPLSTSDMYNDSRTKVDSDMSSTSTLQDDDSQNDENDEDNTARFNSSYRHSTPRTTSMENMSALQRVKSLTERNRQVLDKLTSISRHGSPVPGSSSKASTRSPLSSRNAPSPSNGAGSSRLSTPSRLSISRPRPQSTSKLQTPFSSSTDDRVEHIHSGSETERETVHTSSHTHSYSSSDSLSNTPTSSHAPSERRTSAPTSPVKSPRKNKRTSPGPTRTPRKRASVAVSAADVQRDDSDEEDIAKAALAAVASARRSPGSTSKRNTTRTPLPTEFRDHGRRSVLGDRVEPVTPLRERVSHTPRSPSPPRQPSGSGTPASTLLQSVQRSPRRPAGARYSTVRELTRRHQTRWLSEDLSVASPDAGTDNHTPSRANDNSPAFGRRQGHRTGSSESPYGGRSSILGEGSRSVAASKKREVKEPNADVFLNGQEADSPGAVNGVSAVPTRRTRSSGGASIVNGHGEWDSPSPVGPNGRAGSNISTRPTGSFPSRTLESRTPLRTTSATYATPARPSTSMAALHHDAPPASTFRPSSSRSLREHEASSSAAMLDDPIQLMGTPHVPDRAYTSLFNHSSKPSQGEHNSEHRKLLFDALGMFESQLSRLPPMGQTTTVTIPEVFQNSQLLVQSMDKLHDMLRSAQGRALDSQIDAEVGDIDVGHLDLVDLWSGISTEHRDHLRLTEEITRTMTLFFLGVGRVLRETTMAPGGSLHARATSLDEDAVRRVTPEASSSATSSGRRSADGRISREMRRSWEPRTHSEMRAVARLSSRERGTTSRPTSSAHTHHNGTATSSSEEHSVSENARGAPTPLSARSGGSSILTTSSRRYSPHHEAPSAAVPIPVSTAFMSSLDSQETLRAHEPSPTPLSRHGSYTNHERSRTLAPISIPPSLSTLPSESLLRRTTSALDRNERKKSSTSSNITIRAESMLPPVIKPPNATTALTTATTANVFNDSPIELGPALSRTNSANSTHTNGVTFSRPSSISVSTLNGLQQQHDFKAGRHRVTASVADAPSPISLRSPMSGSETERPRTIASRARPAFGRAADDDANRSRASTLTSTRRTHSRTLTSVVDIFPHAKR